MRTAMVALVCSLAACQPRAQRLLLLDLALSDPLLLESTAAPWHAAGYGVDYRRFYPHLTRHDLARYNTVVLLGGREPEAPSDALTLGDLAILTEWARRGGVVVFGYAGDGEGFGDRWTANRWLAALGAGIVIGDYPLEDTMPPAAGAAEPQPRALPQPQSALDNAGFAPFIAGRNHVLLVDDESQALARTSTTAFIRPPREEPAARRSAPIVTASRVKDGLVIVASRHALAAGGAELRPSTLPAPVAPGELSRTRAFLEALARWTRRPAEWAAVAPAAGEGRWGRRLTLAGAPRPVAAHPPPLEPPAGATAIRLPAPSPAPSRVAAPGWIARQGMRVLWTRPGQRSLESMLAFVDAGALNVLATEVQAPARADSLGLRNLWRPTAERLAATSVRWFPAIRLAELRPEGGGGTRPSSTYAAPAWQCRAASTPCSGAPRCGRPTARWRAWGGAARAAIPSPASRSTSTSRAAGTRAPGSATRPIVRGCARSDWTVRAWNGSPRCRRRRVTTRCSSADCSNGTTPRSRRPWPRAPRRSALRCAG